MFRHLGVGFTFETKKRAGSGFFEPGGRYGLFNGSL